MQRPTIMGAKIAKEVAWLGGVVSMLFSVEELA